MLNHAKIFCKSCFTRCDTSLFNNFSQIAFKNSENAVSLFLTVECLDVWAGEVP